MTPERTTPHHVCVTLTTSTLRQVVSRTVTLLYRINDYVYDTLLTPYWRPTERRSGAVPAFFLSPLLNVGTHKHHVKKPLARGSGFCMRPSRPNAPKSTVSCPLPANTVKQSKNSGGAQKADAHTSPKSRGAHTCLCGIPPLLCTPSPTGG